MAARGETLAILIPSFNDWDALRLLLPRIDKALTGDRRLARVLIVDDASTEPLPQNWPGQSFAAIDSVDILHLRCNLGHQRAIALGLYQLHEFSEASAVIVMDGDGEDRAEDLPALAREFDQYRGHEIIFAARTRRMESLAFQFFYRVYQAIHHMLTGVEVRVGNFSILSRAALARIIASPDLWNNYSAAVYRARFARRLLPLARGKRLTGKSKMNFVSLLMHGVSALSVYSEQMSARLLAASAAFTLLGLAAIGTAWTFRIPGWDGMTTGWLVGLMLQAITFSILFAFLIANRRNTNGFVLQRDAPYFILGKTSLRSAVGPRPSVKTL